MAKTNIRQIAPALRQPGSYSLPNVRLGQTSSMFEIAISRDPTLLDPQVLVATLGIEGSDDGGTTWTDLGSCTLNGGEIRDKQGVITTESVYRIEFRLTDPATGADLGPDPKPASYRLRGNATLFVAATVGLRLTIY